MVFIVLCVCENIAPAGPQGDPAFQQARVLFDSGEIKKAVTVWQRLRNEQPDNDEVVYWLAESALAMEQYDRAQALYTELLERTPQHIAARHRRWLVQLAAAQDLKQARQAVRQEIDGLTATGCADVSCRYIVYRGYKYLWDRKRRGSAMLELLVRLQEQGAPDVIAGSLPGELLEETLQALPPLRRTLAQAFLRNFPRRRGIDLASRIAIDERIDTGMTVAAYHALVRDHAENRFLRLHAVSWLLSKRALAGVEQALTEYDDLFQRQIKEERHWYASEAGWRQITQWEQALKNELSGRLAMARQQWQVALQVLQTSLPRHRKPSRVWAALAQVYTQTGQTDLAIDAWRQALASGNTDPNANKALNALLESKGIVASRASAYFAKQQAVVEFSDVTALAGLQTLQSQRVAWGDFDGDGDADLLLDGPRVLRNEHGVFQDVTRALGLNSRMRTTGGLWVDVDNDGWLDLWLTGRRANFLYKNVAGERFTAVTDEVFTAQRFTGRTEAAAWGDLNNDGWLDLYTANYEKRGLQRGMCYRDQLFLNNKGRLREAGLALGTRVDAPLCGRGAMWVDIDNDGRQDVLVANYRTDRNLLWLNRGGSFIEAAQDFAIRAPLRDGAYGNSTGFAVADVDNDLKSDLYLSNLAHPRYIDITDTSRLLVNKGEKFVDQHGARGLAYEESSADPVFADFDNDGDMDLYISSIYPRALSHLYRNEGGRFRDVTWLSGTRADDGWGVAVADYDNDGDLDLLVARARGIRLFRNNGSAGHWVQIAVRSEQCNRYGVGASITIETDGHRQQQSLYIGRGSGSQDDLVAHFGLADTAMTEAKVSVRDLCGGEVSATVAVDRRSVLRPVAQE